MSILRDYLFCIQTTLERKKRKKRNDLVATLKCTYKIVICENRTNYVGKRKEK